MVRLTVIFFVFAMLACGGSDTGQPGAAGEAAPTGEMAGAPDTPEPPGATVDQNAKNCLGLVNQGWFQQAVPVCTATLKMDPGNQQVQKALEQARAGTAKAASQAAGEAAAGQAGSELEEEAGGMADRLSD